VPPASGKGIETIEQTCARQAREIEALKEQNRLLEQKLEHLIRRLFGSKSEKLDPAQVGFLFKDMPEKPGASTGADAPVEAASSEDKPVAATPAKRAGHRSRIKGLDQLPVETEEIIPDLVAAEPEAYERIGQETTEQLDYIPARFIRRLIVRPKFRRKTQRHLPPVLAPAPVTPLLGGLPSAALLAHLLVGKYIDHLPVYRQEKIFQRSGVHIPRDLIIHWLHKSIELLEPVARAIRRETLASGYLQIDETPVRYLAPGTGKAPQGYLWVVNVPGGSLFYHWGVGRGTAALIECVGESRPGVIQCDALGTYTSYWKKQAEGSLCLMSCLAHIRRNFHDVFESGPHPHAALVLRLIARLYRIEEQLREAKAGPALREAVRASQSAMIYHRTGRIMKALLKRHRPQHVMGKALAYGLANWERLGEYLRDGRIEIDNNLAENAVRPLKLGEKNWLFFGSKNAGHAAATIYTIVENCRRHGIVPEPYLAGLLDKLPVIHDPLVIDSLTPARLAAAASRRNTRAA